MASYAHAERQALADLFLQVGPDAPTLCAGWKTRDLAAHLIVRERRPDAAVAGAIPPLNGYAARISGQVATRPWPELVATVRDGPPAPFYLVDEPINTVEFFVHHEDVRRAAQTWEPRALDPGLELALWKRLRSPFGRLLTRSAPTGVEVRSLGYGTVRLHGGEETVTVAGPPSEVTLFLFGRGSAARVELEGEPAAVTQLKGARLGL